MLQSFSLCYESIDHIENIENIIFFNGEFHFVDTPVVSAVMTIVGLLMLWIFADIPNSMNDEPPGMCNVPVRLQENTLIKQNIYNTINTIYDAEYNVRIQQNQLVMHTIG